MTAPAPRTPDRTPPRALGKTRRVRRFTVAAVSGALLAGSAAALAAPPALASTDVDANGCLTGLAGMGESATQPLSSVVKRAPSNLNSALLLDLTRRRLAESTGPKVASLGDLAADASVRVDRCGALLYADTFEFTDGEFVDDHHSDGAADGASHAHSDHRASTDASLRRPDRPHDADIDTTNLASRPGAPVTIYLDFNGATVTNTAWNDTAGGTIVAAPFDPDLNPGTSAEDRADLWTTWKVIADRFAMFDINVTTVEPPVSDLERTSPSDTRYGATVVFTDSPDLPGKLCGGFDCAGIAYMDTVGQPNTDYYQPAWLFASVVPPVYAGAVAAHEIGHNFGLLHMGYKGTEYFGMTPAGDQNPPSSHWRPTMGLGTPMGQWSTGTYTGATNRQDALAQIGLTARTVTDEPSALPLSGSLTGVIATSSDTDTYTVTVPAGQQHAITLRALTQSGLIGQISVRDTNGAVIGSATGYADYDAIESGYRYTTVDLPTNQSQATYTVTVDGVAANNTAGARDDYGSLGEYRIYAGEKASPTITPGSQRTAISGTYANIRLATASGGTRLADGFQPQGGSYLWDLPNGLPLNLTWGTERADSSSLVLYGMVENPGTYEVPVKVTAPNGTSTTMTVSFTVQKDDGTAQPPLEFTKGASKIRGQVGKKVSVTFAASGGAFGTQQWRITSGQLPPGLTLKVARDGQGVQITGKPRASGRFPVTLAVTDSAGTSISRRVTVKIR